MSNRTLVEDLLTALRDNPQDWRPTNYDRPSVIEIIFRLQHQPSGVSLWVANGATGLDIRSQSAGKWKPSLHDRFRLWRAYRDWQEYTLYDAFMAQPKQEDGDE